MNWKRKFDKKFPLDGGIWVLKRHRDEVKVFIRQQIDKAVKQEKDLFIQEILLWMDIHGEKGVTAFIKSVEE